MYVATFPLSHRSQYYYLKIEEMFKEKNVANNVDRLSLRPP